MSFQIPGVWRTDRPPRPAGRRPRVPKTKMKTFEVTLDTGKRLMIEAEQVTEARGWLIFRVKNINVGRFPAATTTYRIVEDQPQKYSVAGAG